MTLLNFIRNGELQNAPSAPRNQFPKHGVDNNQIKKSLRETDNRNLDTIIVNYKKKTHLN